MRFPLTIATVDKNLFSGEAYSVMCPGREGEFTVLARHMPFISILEKGVLQVKKKKDAPAEIFPVTRGLLEASKEGVVVFLESQSSQKTAGMKTATPDKKRAATQRAAASLTGRYQHGSDTDPREDPEEDHLPQLLQVGRLLSSAGGENFCR